MNNNWWQLPEMSAGQATDYMEYIRKFNEYMSNVSADKDEVDDSPTPPINQP